jgi:hypothetical protein
MQIESAMPAPTLVTSRKSVADVNALLNEAREEALVLARAALERTQSLTEEVGALASLDVLNPALRAEFQTLFKAMEGQASRIKSRLESAGRP